MEDYRITREQIAAYGCWLRQEERARGTVAQYLRNLRTFVHWLDGGSVTREVVAAWKEHLLEDRYAPVTVNSMLAVLNGFFRFMGWDALRVKFLKIQRQVFRDQSRELNRDDYGRLVETARSLGRDRLALLMETICATGIRVSEVRYITVEAAQSGRAEIALKGKIRTILIPNKLCRKLLKYAKKQKTASGEIFLTKGGMSLSRKQIWAEMKSLSKRAGVEPSKVFPHNLRHLFATAYYRAYKDLVKLADVLGHSSIETTRIYLISSGSDHARQLERLGLVS